MPTQTSTMVGVVQAIKFLPLFDVSSRLLAGGFELRRIPIKGSISAQFEPFHASNSKGKRFPGSLGQQIANRALFDFLVWRRAGRLQRHQGMECRSAPTRTHSPGLCCRHSHARSARPIALFMLEAGHFWSRPAHVFRATFPSAGICRGSATTNTRDEAV